MAEQKRYFRTPRAVIAGRVLAILLIVLFLLRIFTSIDFAAPDGNYLYVYVLDVGQSDAILLRTGEHTMLIDTAVAAEETALRTALFTYGVERLDYLVLTHPHEDHIGNARWMMETMEIGKVLLPAVSVEDDAYEFLCKTAEKFCETETAQTGQRFMLGNAGVEVLWAGGDIPISSDVDRNVNNMGTVLRITFGTQVFLFMGDAEQETEARLLTLYGQAHLDCDYLQVGHHGSDTSTTADFVNSLTPTVAAISCGKDNSYGFPHKAVLQNLAAVGSNVYRTDQQGTLVFGTDGNEIRVIPKNTKGL